MSDGRVRGRRGRVGGGGRRKRWKGGREGGRKEGREGGRERGRERGRIGGGGEREP